MDSLLYKTDALNEEVSVYGVEDTSKYISLPDAKNLKEKEVYISKPFSDKYDVAVGDTVTLNAKYEKKKYLFKVKGFFEHSQSIAVFMPIEQYRTVFDKGEDAFDGFFTNTKIKDVKKDYIATVITEREIISSCNNDCCDHLCGTECFGCNPCDAEWMDGYAAKHERMVHFYYGTFGLFQDVCVYFCWLFGCHAL